MATVFKLPGLGESVDSIDVIKVLVNEGDRIEQDQNVLELETGKAVLELPAPFSGTVQELLVSEGDHIKVGQDLMLIKEDGSSEGGETVNEEKEKQSEENLATEQRDEPEEDSSPSEDKAKQPDSADKGDNLERKEGKEADELPEKPDTAIAKKSGQLVPAAPSVRKFAREIGVDVNAVPGSGKHGRVSIDDVKAYAKHLNQTRPEPEQHGFSLPPLPKFEAWGDVKREQMTNVRYQTAIQVTKCWSQIPMVTQFDQANITKLEDLRKKYAAKATDAGGKLTMAVMMVKIAASALKIFPQFNASVDVNKKEIIYKKYFNIGIAVSTDKGLFVPVLKSVDQKNMVQIASEVSEIAKKTRAGKLMPADMEGGCFTVTNLGNIGGTHFTPIVNYPEVAILGMGRAYTMAGYVNGELQPQVVLPLSLSYDHRIIDGADGARFLKWIVEAIEEPLLLSLEG